MWLSVLLVTLGFLLLGYGADRLIHGAATLARHVGVSPLIVGLTVVALGTSLPEIVVAIQAAWQQNPGLAIGNALGSNIANIGLVLGVCALVRPIVPQTKIIRRELPFLFLTMLLITLLIIDGDFTRRDGAIILLGLMGFLLLLVRQIKSPEQDQKITEAISAEYPIATSLNASLGAILLGIVLLPLSAHLIVTGSVDIAHYFGVSDLLIGLTLVALGTSLPELAAALSATIKHEYDLVLGNVFGSNLFNLLLVLPMPGVLSPARIQPQILIRDVGFMFLMTIILYVLLVRKKPIYRGSALILLNGYLLYLLLLWCTRHDPNTVIQVIT